MSTIEIEKFETFDYKELSEEAKETAYINWIENQTEWDWADDAIESMKSFATHFGVTIKDYAIGGVCQQRNFVSFEIPGEEAVPELSYVRLWKYLNNSNYLTNGLLDGNCPFTGVCYDESLLDIIRDFIKKPYDISFYDLIDSCFDKWLKMCSDDQEYQISRECFEDYANGDQYLESGKVYC